MSKSSEMDEIGALVAAVALKHSDPVFQRELSERVHACLAAGGKGGPAAADIMAAIYAAPSAGVPVSMAASSSGIGFAAFWWGCHFAFPEAVVGAWTTGGIAAASFAAAMTKLIASGTKSGPLISTVVAAVSTYIALEFALMKVVDRGKGVYLSMLWIAPGIFVPTAIA